MASAGASRSTDRRLVEAGREGKESRGDREHREENMARGFEIKRKGSRSRKTDETSRYEFYG